MKIGIHEHVFTSRLTPENLNIFDFIKEIGFDSMDVNVRNTDLEFAKTVRKRAEKLDIILTGGGSIPKGFEFLSPEKQKRMEALDYMKELIRRVSEIGATLYHGLIYATSGFFTGKGPTLDEIEYSIENLQQAADYAKKLGVSLCLEPANRYETYVLNTVKDSMNMVANIDRPNVGLLLDTYHMNIEEKNMYESIVSSGSKLFHFHVNENDRGIPGSGHILWDEVFRALKDINYEGIATVESFVDGSVDIASLVAIWRKLAPSEEILARQSYSFIEKMALKYSL